MESIVKRTLTLLVFALNLFVANHLFATAYTWNVAGPSNWNTPASWSPMGVPAGGDSGAINSGIATANVVLPGSPTITVGGTGTLNHGAIAGTTAIASSITVQSGGTMNWNGNAADLTPTFFSSGSSYGRGVSNGIFTIDSPISFTSGTITATGILGTVYDTQYALTLAGTISGSGNLFVNQTLASHKGVLQIKSASANPFNGTVTISGTPTSLGILALQGTGALANATGFTINPNGILRLNTSTDALASGMNIAVGAGAAIEWGGHTSYTYAPANVPTLTFGNNSSFGRGDSNAFATSREQIVIGAGNTVNVSSIRGTVYDTQYGLVMAGPISGSGIINVTPATTADKGVLRIAPTSANPFTGTLVVGGSAAVQGYVALEGTGALANASAVTINPYGTLRFNTSTDALKSGVNVPVAAGANIEWGGHTSYTYAPANIPTLTFANGSSFGRGDSNAFATSREQIVIGAGNTVNVSSIRGTVYDTQYGLVMAGPISGSGIINVNPATTSDKGALRIAPTSANPFTGTVVISGSPTVQGVVALEGTGALRNISALSLNANGILRFNTSTDSLPNGFGVNVPSGARVEWGGNSTYTGVAPTITFNTGSTLGRTDSNAILTGTEAIAIPSGNTALATGIYGTVYDNQYALTLAGPISGSGTLRVEPTLSTHKGTLRLNPSTANSFTGTVEIGGNSSATGYLSMSGTGALANISGLSLEQYGALRFNAATNPLPSGFLVNVQSGGRVEWLGTSTYSVTKPTIQFQNGSSFGRVDANGLATAVENISLASGATVTAGSFAGTVLQQHYGINFTGTLTGDNSTTLIVRPSTGSGQIGVMTINSATANSGFSSNVIVRSVDSTYRGVLILNGAGPLGSATVDVEPNSILTVGNAGSLDNVTSVNVQSGGSVRFRVNGGSTLDNTTITGNGLLRSEITVGTTSNQQADYTVQPLTLTNTVLSPGNSVGTLSVNASTLTLGAGTTLQTELGLTPDVLAVTGNLVLTPGSTLEISNIAGFTPGTHVIATYSGTLTGEFGTLVNNLNAIYLLNGINYGTGTNSFISIDVSFAPVPEPNTGLLAGLGFIGAMIVRRKKRAQK